MSIVPDHSTTTAAAGLTDVVPRLEAGDCLDQPTFHRRYKAMPPGTRAELIGGVVVMPSPLHPQHGRMHTRLMGWLIRYEEATPGTELHDNTTAILGEDSETQADAQLLIVPQCGGQTREQGEQLLGAPELVAEIASSTEAYDLHGKKAAYERAGVKEYLVVALRQSKVFWFVARQGRFEPLPLSPDGIYRSETFPGLWLDATALLERNAPRLAEIVQQGLASAEHAQFVAKLAAARR